MICLWWTYNRQAQPHGERSPFLVTAAGDFQGPAGVRLASRLSGSESKVRWTDCYSPFTDSFTRYNVNPWARHWKSKWEAGFNAAFENPIEKRNLKLDVWKKQLLEVTGGHPALFGPAVEYLDILVNSSEKELSPLEAWMLGMETEFDPAGRDLEDEIRRCVEGQLRDGTRVIWSAIRSLKDSKEMLKSACYTTVLEIARNNSKEGAPPPHDMTIRQVLEDEALVFEDPDTGRYRIAGSSRVSRRPRLDVATAFADGDAYYWFNRSVTPATTNAIPAASRDNTPCLNRLRDTKPANKISISASVRTLAALSIAKARNHICDANAPMKPAFTEGRHAANNAVNVFRLVKSK